MSTARARRPLALLVLFLVCATTAPATPGTAGPPSPTAVVADLGWSINPYHAVFRRPGWTSPPAIPGIGAMEPLPLTLGSDYAASRAADDALWNAYRPGVLYWIPGTNLLLRTIRSPGVLPDGATDDSFHGTGTSGVLADECPACYVLFLQDAPILDGTAVAAVVDDLPWVDFVVSTNHTGWWVAPPIAAQTRRLHDSGRIFFAATGNHAATAVAPGALYYGYALPPWVVSTGGGRPECRGTDARAARPAEIVGRFVTRVALHASVNGRVTASGTSFAAPQLAAGFAEVLLAVRRAFGDTRAHGSLWAGVPRGSGVLSDGSLTAEEIRSVAWRAARRFQTAEFDAACVDPSSVVAEEGVAGPASATPWIEMGWGYFGAGEASAAATAIVHDQSLPADAGAAAYMNALMLVRSAAFI